MVRNDLYNGDLKLYLPYHESHTAAFGMVYKPVLVVIA